VLEKNSKTDRFRVSW